MYPTLNQSSILVSIDDEYSLPEQGQPEPKGKTNNTNLLIDLDDWELCDILKDEHSSGSDPDDCPSSNGNWKEKPDQSNVYRLPKKPFRSQYPPTPNWNICRPPNNRFVYGQPNPGDITDTMPNFSKQTLIKSEEENTCNVSLIQN